MRFVVDFFYKKVENFVDLFSSSRRLSFEKNRPKKRFWAPFWEILAKKKSLFCARSPLKFSL